MGNYENLKQSITEVIRTNGNKEITGAVLQSTLLTIISTVGANATFAGIATPTTNPGTPDGPVFYLASKSGTYSNFNAIELQDGLSVLMWNGSWNSQQIFSIDNEPTSGSDNLVKSGGVAEELALGTVYDVSAKNPTAGVNNDGKWESLSALLSDTNLNTLIPTPIRKGGMSIKFVQSSDNKYVQYLCNSQSFTIDVTAWEKIAMQNSITELNAIIETCIKEFPTAQISDTSILSSLDNCSNNTIYRINCGASDVPANCPFHLGIVVNIGWNKDGVDTFLQLAKGFSDDDLYIRLKWDQYWSPFRKLAMQSSITELNTIVGTCLKEFPTAQISDTSILSSLDDCSNNTIYRINCGTSDVPANCPINQGIVANIGWNKDGVDTFLQLVKGYSNGDLYIRIKWNQDWYPFRKYVDVNEKNQEVDFGFIEKFAIIGDSYASGEIYVEDAANPRGYVAGDYYNKSWGQILARKYGAKCINMSVGGLTTKTWLTSQKGLSLLNSSDAQELYLCALGHNDMTEGLTYLGTISDIETKADSFYGNYATIIEAIQSKAPNGKIVLLTCAYLYNSVEDAFNEAIKNIANAYNIPYIDIKNDSYYSRNSIYHTGKMYNHPTAPLYAGMAKANARLFNKCVKQYYDYFKTLT